MSDKPIGIFDSGVGGLTVCKSIHDILPGEHIIYFGDTARFPYGTRSRETIIRYSREITEFLLSRGVKMIVIACNTASAAALETIRSQYPIPVIGVIEAGAKAACRRLQGNLLGVIATRATVNSGSYIKEIRKINPAIEVHQRHATLFVQITEEGLTDSEIARLAARNYIQEMYDQGVRTLILGCTHFPLLKKTINSVYGDLDLVDTGMEIAYEVKKILEEKNLAIPGRDDKIGTIELYASDITETYQRLKDIFFGTNGATITKLAITGQ